MCGRFAQFNDKISDTFKAKPDRSGELEFKFNYSPGNKIKIITKENNGRIITESLWGLVTNWTIKQNLNLINIRAESLSEKKGFQGLFQTGRCLIPSDGFYEWKKEGKHKTPYFIRLKSQEPFAFAGIHTFMQDTETGENIHSCSIITTQANSLVSPVHNRMPVILKPEDYDLWLDPDQKDLKGLSELLKPYNESEMEVYPVSGAVNKATNNSIQLIKRVDPCEANLFSSDPDYGCKQ